MRDGREMKKLGDILTIERGGSPRPIGKYLTNSKDGINWIKIADATASDKYIYKTKQKITKEGLHKTRLVNEGDFILSNSMSFGRPYIMKTKGAIHDGWLVLKQNGKKVFESEFLYYLLSSQFVYKQFNSLAAGSTVRNLNISLVSSVQVPVPAFSEQQRIVSILNQGFAEIEKARIVTEQNLNNASELFKSSLQGVFEKKGKNWKEFTLKEVSTEFSRGKSKHRPRGDKSILGGKYPLIQTGDVGKADHWIKSYSSSYNKKGLEQSKLWYKGTICIAIVGANVAETAILNFDSCFPDSVIGVVVDPQKANNEYVEYLLQSFKTILKRKGKGTARDNINMGTFQNQKFPFPDIYEQQKIVSRLNFLSTETKKLEAIYKQKLLNLEELKKSVLQKAFNGEM